MKILVTGCNGFVGRHAMATLQTAGHEAIGSDITASDTSLTLDVRNRDDIQAVLRQVQPEAILHLGGLAFVPLGWSDPQSVFHVNTIGTLNVLDAVRRETPATRILIVTSAEVYGSRPAPAPLTEDAPYRPDNIYGIAKAAADQAALLYANHHQLNVMVARPSNHIGPCQSKDFVSSAFAAQLAAIAAGAPPTIHVGNLDQQRDFTDVRDVTRAYTLLLERGHAGHAYNIASGLMIPVRHILETLCQIAGIHPNIVVDADLYRPNKDRPAYDTTRIRKHVGWQPEITLAKTLATIYADFHPAQA